MAAITTTWDATAPASSENAKNGAVRIQNVKAELVERLRNGGQRMQTSGATTDAKDGRHLCGESNAAGSTELAGEFTIYAADGTTAVAVFRDSTAATPSELYLVANTLRTTGTVKGATINATSLIKPDTDAAVDLGITATNRFRDLWLSRNVEIGGTAHIIGIATFDAVPVFSAGSTFATLNVSTKFTNAGGQQNTIITHSSGTHTVLLTERIILCNVTSTSVIVQLPTAASAAGYDFIISILGEAGSANIVAITPNGTEKISNIAGPTTYNLVRNVAGDRCGVHLISNGSAWTVLSAYYLSLANG